MSDTAGPWIVWTNHGYDGWHPTSYATLQDAALAKGYGCETVLTEVVPVRVVDDRGTKP